MRPTVSITDLADPRVAHYANLKDRQTALLDEKQGVFIAEGELVLRRLIASKYRTLSVLLAPNRDAGLRDALERLPPDVPVFVADQRVMNAIVGFNIHRGVLAVAQRPETATTTQLLEARPPALVVLEELANLDNMGAIFRNVAALAPHGTAVLLSPGCCDPLYRKSVRVSVGNVLSIAFGRSRSWYSDLELVRGAGYRLIALTPEEGSASIRSVQSTGGPSALLLGAEGPGLARRTLDLADLRVRVPMNPEADSLNVATTAALALHELMSHG